MRYVHCYDIDECRLDFYDFYAPFSKDNSIFWREGGLRGSKKHEKPLFSFALNFYYIKYISLSLKLKRGWNVNYYLSLLFDLSCFFLRFLKEILNKSNKGEDVGSLNAGYFPFSHARRK